MRIALATDAEFADLFFDDEPLRAGLLSRGAAVDAAVWDDPGRDWAAYDLVVIRSTWDYVERRDEFVRWAYAVPRLANSARLVEWNTDKTYLRGLGEAGVPVVPTAWVDTPASLPDLLAERGWERAVVKPAVSAGARDTLLCSPDDPEAQALLDRLASNGTAMVQPYLPSVEEYGERSLLFMDGALTHAVRRNPALTTEGFTRYDAARVDPADDELAVARAVFAQLPETPLYARVDVARDASGTPLLMELEVTEPQLFLRFAPEAAEALAAAVVARAGSAGSSTTTGS
jgi:glutathione synthase/RimK-type ligase-like ATP-grasp enzyme